MKKATVSSSSILAFSIFALLLLSFPVIGQETSKVSTALPDSISKIVLVSCVPCHTSKGGLLSKGKLNFTEWTSYSPEKQKNRAEKMYSELKKGEMPPKSARQTRPEIIPTKEQIEIIKNWSESFGAVGK
jgi:hypothetical protein